MPNGRIGDNPLTDLFAHGLHPFPADMEQMLVELRRLDPACGRHFQGEEFAWEQGRRLDEGRAKIRELLQRARGDASADAREG
jgi:hypothetical protein